MNTDTSTHEVDMKEAYHSFKSNTLNFLVKFVKFIKSNFLILLLLGAIGFGLGYLADKYLIKYKSTILVTPHFSTADYLYESIELLNSKIGQNDKEFLSKVGIEDDYGIQKVTIEAMPEIYDFVSRSEQNYNVFKTLSDNASAKDVLEDLTTSKNFSRHIIEIQSKHKIPQSVLDNIIKYLNSSEYYEFMREIIQKNIKERIDANTETIAQIDAILKLNGDKASNEASIYIKENSELNELVENKLELVENIHFSRTLYHELDYIITPNDSFINMTAESTLSGKYKFLFPILLILLFFGYKIIRILDRMTPNELAK